MRAVVVLLLVLAAGTVSANAPVKYQASLQGNLLSKADILKIADDDMNT